METKYEVGEWVQYYDSLEGEVRVGKISKAIVTLSEHDSFVQYLIYNNNFELNGVVTDDEILRSVFQLID